MLSLVLAVFVYRGVLFTAGIPEYGDFQFHLESEWAKASYLYTWNFYFSRDNAPYLGFYPWFSWLMQIGSMEVTVRLLLVLTFVYMSMAAFHVTFAFAKKIFKKSSSCYVASIVASVASTMNPWFMIRISHYPYQWMIATAFLVLYFVDKVVNEIRKKKVLKYALTLSLFLIFGSVLFYNIVYLALFLIFTLLLVFFTSNVRTKIKVLNSILFLLILTTASFFLLSYFIFPLSFSGLGQTYSTGPPWVPKMTLAQSSLNWRNAQVANVFRLASFWSIGIEYYLSPEWLKPLWVLSTMALPVVAFLAIYFKPKERIIQIATILAVTTVLLASGPQESLRNFYLWLMDKDNLLYHLLHDPDRFSGFLVLSYALLGGITVGEAFNKMWHKRSARKKVAGFLFILMMCSFSFLSAYPLLTGNFQGYLEPLKVPNEYYHANEWLKAQEGEFRVMWLPPSSLVPWASHPLPLVPPLSLWISSKPVLFPGGEPFERVLNNLIFDVLMRNETRNLGKILNLANVRFILYHNDTLDSPEFSSALTSLQKQRDMSLVFKENEIYIFENKRWNSKNYIYAVNKSLIVVGGLDALLPLLDIETFDPSKFALVFLEQRPLSTDLLARLMDFESILLIHGNKDFDDLLLDTISEEFYYAPYNHIGRLQNIWYMDTSYSWTGLHALLENQPRGQQEFDLNKGFIWTSIEGEETTYDFIIDAKQNGEYQIWVRVMFSRAGGKVSFQLDQKEPYTIDTVSGPFGFKWVKIYEATLNKGSHKISITNEMGQNIVNLLAVVPSSYMVQHTNKIMTLLTEKDVKFLWVRDRHTFAYKYEVSYETSSDYFGDLMAEAGRWVNDKLVSIAESVKWEVTEGVLYTSAPPYFRFIYPKNLTFSEGILEAMVKVDNNGTAPYLGFRAQNVNNLYIFGFVPWNNFFELSKFVNGSQHRLFRLYRSVEVGRLYKLRVELKEDRISLFIDGVLIKDLTDETFKRGKFGFWVYNLDAYLINLKIMKAKLELSIPTLPLKSTYMVALYSRETDDFSSLTVANQTITSIETNSWQYLEPITVTPNQIIKVTSPTPEAIDKIAIYSSQTSLEEFLGNLNPLDISLIERPSPTEFLVKINASNPFLLVFLEKYNDHWEATLGNMTTEKVILFSAYNGFLIPEHEHSTLMLRFPPERYLQTGVSTSAFSLILILCLILLLDRRLRKNLKKIVSPLTKRITKFKNIFFFTPTSNEA
jgi:hypothetical protein